jgi:hypothetical protein
MSAFEALFGRRDVSEKLNHLINAEVILVQMGEVSPHEWPLDAVSIQASRFMPNTWGRGHAAAYAAHVHPLVKVIANTINGHQEAKVYDVRVPELAVEGARTYAHTEGKIPLRVTIAYCPFAQGHIITLAALARLIP